MSGAATAADKLAFLIPNLFGPDGLRVDSAALLPDGSSHSAHYNSSFQESFTPFNQALATQLASVQIPSPASGITYTFDSTLGVFNRSTQSFGPILSDRAETIGRNKFAVGFHYQHFTFDSLEGVDLGSIPSVFTHDNAAPGGRADVVTTSNSLDITMDQFMTFATYGVTDRFDLAVGIPVLSVDFSATSLATIQRLGTASSPLTHYYRQADGSIGTQRTFSSSGSASGIGDVLVRAKGTIYKSGATGLALGLDARLPTGDEENLLGSGALSLKPFLAFSYSHSGISPHVKMAYQWNGESVLAGNVTTGEKADLPDIVFYEAGADIGLAKQLTLAFDLLGKTVINGERLVSTTFHGLDANQTAFPNVLFQTDSFTQLDGAVGIKTNLKGNLLLDLNITFKLNDTGLRDNLTTLAGLEYTF
jgi:hypothetical protein